MDPNFMKLLEEEQVPSSIWNWDGRQVYNGHFQDNASTSMSGALSQGSSESQLNARLPAQMMVKIVISQLDMNRAMLVDNLYQMLKKREICEDVFLRHLQSIVGDQIYKSAVYELKSQVDRDSQTASFRFQSQQQVLSNAKIITETSNLESGRCEWELPEVENRANSSRMQEERMQFRVIEGKTSTLQQCPDSYSAALYKGSSQTETHCLPQWQTLDHYGVGHFPCREYPINYNFPSPVGDRFLRLDSYEQQIPAAGYSQIAPYRIQSQHKAFAHQLQMSSNDISNPESVSDKWKSPDVENKASSSRMQSTSRAFSIGPGNRSEKPSVTSKKKKPSVNKKKRTQACDSSSPPLSKNQKMTAAVLDQSIEHLNDVTAVSGVNLEEETKYLFPDPKEKIGVSESSRSLVEKEDRMMLHKIPLQKKLLEIMTKYDLKSTTDDVERCLSLCVEERMRRLILNLIRMSKKHTDEEKAKHKTVITSDVMQFLKINRKASEDCEKKQAETEPLLILDSTLEVDGDKEKHENSLRSKKEEFVRMRACAANRVVRAATGVGDMLSRWQLMSEAKRKHGEIGKSYASEPNTHALISKVGRNRVNAPEVVPHITVKDVVAVLEREPHMSRSTLIYRLYDK